MWLLFSFLAHATDVAGEKRFGLGLSTGAPWAAVTGKYYVGPDAALAFYVGTAGWYASVQGEYQKEIVEITDFDFARFPLYWHAGADVGRWNVYGDSSARIGVTGGLGANLQFHNLPLEVFADISLGIYVINGYCGSGAGCLFGAGAPGTLGIGRLGARWFF